MARSNKRSWWEGFQDSKYPAYVTCIHPKIFGITLKKKARVSQVAVDDVLDAEPANGQWQPKTFELKKGSCVFVLPEDATSADKAAVSEPWMVRINQMWFMGRKGVQQPTVKDDKAVIKWEQQQLQKSRLSVQQFDLEVNYFYRLSDLESDNALAGRHGPKNIKTLCQALVKLGIIDTVQAGEELIKKRGRGATKAHRLLSRFVCFSTHEGKLPPDSPSKSSDDDDDEEGSSDEGEDQADTPIPMESVMGPFKVFCLGAQQRLPYLAAPVAAKAQRGENQELLPSMRRVQKDAVLEEQQQQHRALPHGFFCNLIFCKQEGQLLWLEDWAAGTVGPKTGDWVQASREQAADLLATTRAELEALQQDVSQQQQEPASSLDGRVRGRGKRAAAAAAGGSGPDSDTGGNDLQHSQQHTQPAVLPQRRTPRKRQHPRKAEQEPEQQEQRRRLRSAADAAAAAGDADLDSLQVSSGDEADASDGAPARKKRRGRAVQAVSTDTGKESSPPSTQVIDSSDDDVQEAVEVAPSRAAAAAAGRHAGTGAQRRSSDVLRSSKASAALPRRGSKAMQQL